MRAEGFDAEGFGCVMTAVENVEAEFFGHGVGPMRSFAGDESVDAFVGGFFEIASRTSGDYADPAARILAAGNEQGFCAGCALKAQRQLRARNLLFALKSQMLAAIEKEGAQFF